MQHLLLVDDEAHILNALYRTLRPRFGKVLKMDQCASADEALIHGTERAYAVVVSDLRMPGMDGISFLARFAEIQPHSVRLLLTGSADFATAQRAVNEIGIYRYMTKPWGDQELLVQIQAALDHATACRDQRAQADAWAASQGVLAPQELERRRLEALEPGMTQVEWGSDGAVIMPPLDSQRP
jgi:two-component system, probable response regulator PhcQ